MSFEWDEEKRQENIRKHKIDFVDAIRVFDSDFLEELDVDNWHEERWRVIGPSRPGILMVVYTDRRNTKRIISARKANRHEEAKYHTRYARRSP